MLLNERSHYRLFVMLLMGFVGSETANNDRNSHLIIFSFG